MIFWQQLFIAAFAFFNLVFFIKGIQEITKKNNPYGITNHLLFIGAFVWGDVIVLSPFWIIVSFVCLFLNNFPLFLLFVSTFWTIRSLGEIIYWLNEQFAVKNHNPPHTLNFYFLIKSDAIWFVYQVFWQCFFVFSLIISIYFCKIWLASL